MAYCKVCVDILILPSNGRNNYDEEVDDMLRQNSGLYVITLHLIKFGSDDLDIGNTEYQPFEL